MSQAYAVEAHKTLHVLQEETVESYIYTLNLPGGSRVEDTCVQVEEEETLLLSLEGYKVCRFKLSPQARPEAIHASFKDGYLTITIPKSIK